MVMTTVIGCILPALLHQKQCVGLVGRALAFSYWRSGLESWSRQTQVVKTFMKARILSEKNCFNINQYKRGYLI